MESDLALTKARLKEALEKVELVHQAMTVLADKPEVGRSDAALLVEELAGIYSTFTPKGWHGAEKSKLYLIDLISFYNSRGQIFILGA